MSFFQVCVMVIIECVISLAAMMFAFHCGFIYGRYGISAHEYNKRRKAKLRKPETGA